MQFRIQGKKLQCIRSTYDPASKRSHQKVVAALSRWADKYSSDEVVELTPAELAELDAFLSKKREANQQSTHDLAVWSATRSTDQTTLETLADAITTQPINDQQAATIWRGLSAVSKALKKAGYPKPKQQKAPSAPEGQGDLLGGVEG